MKTQDFTLTFTVDQSPEEVYNAINDVRGWWSDDFKGDSQKQGDEFEVRFEELHYSRHKVTELVPGKKVEWLVTDSELSFLQHKTEWTGTRNIFEIGKEDNKTQVHFTHAGLTPTIECYGACSGGWNYFLLQSLLPFIATGQGKPNLPKEGIPQEAVNA
ncbi:MAG: SRPBCC domain-containing protein [Flavobacterium sp.]|nr:MAG: SRPBCC domain-containing protein [Flavobacterium sp.]